MYGLKDMPDAAINPAVFTGKPVGLVTKGKLIFSGLMGESFNLWGKTVEGTPGRPGLWIRNLNYGREWVFENFGVRGGSKNIEVVDCTDKITIRNFLVEAPTGPADPAGQGIHVIRSNKVYIEDGRIEAGPMSEDRIGVYGADDAGKRMGATAYIQRVTINGRGRSDSGNGVTFDLGAINCEARDLEINDPGQVAVAVADGFGHKVGPNIKCTKVGWATVYVSGQYDDRGQPCAKRGKVVLVRDTVVDLYGLVLARPVEAPDGFSTGTVVR